MEFYITPDRRQECEKKLAQLFKKLDCKPVVNYSNVQKVEKKTQTVFKTEDGVVVDKHSYTLDAIKVEIEDFVLNDSRGDWVMVAGVYYREGMVTLVSNKYFGKMPTQYGLNYTRCDYCGGTHGNRIKSVVLYNPVADEWMQVGSTCVNKIFAQGKYLGNLIVKLYEVFQVNLCGCDSDGWLSGGWCPPDHYWSKAITIESAVAVCKAFWDADENHHQWKRAIYDDYGRNKIQGGTNDALMDLYERKDVSHEIDSSLYAKIVSYVDAIEGGYELDWYGAEVPKFNQKIKDAFECGYIQAGEMYLAYFALKGYYNSLTMPEFDKALKDNGIEKGVKYTFCGTLDKVENVQGYDYYGDPCIYLMAFLTDSQSGLKFVKEISHSGVMIPYKQEDGTYKFNAMVRWIDRKNKVVKLAGRLSKVPKAKAKKSK